MCEQLWIKHTQWEPQWWCNNNDSNRLFNYMSRRIRFLCIWHSNNVLCICSGFSSISTPIVLLFNEIVINAHTWTTQLNYNMPILLNEKQFLMCDDKRWHLFSSVCVRFLYGRFKKRNGERIVHCTRRTCTSFRSHPHLVTFPPKTKESAAPLQTKCALLFVV